MDLKAIVAGLADCPCGKKHDVAIDAVEIGRGLVSRAGELLSANGFPKKILLVVDDNTIKAADGVIDSLKSAGFDHTLRLYENLRVANMEDVDAIAKQAADFDGILSVGSGSLNDICRLAALKADRKFAIFATAPSMDGFASCTAPITVNNFKRSYPARQPSVIIADTDILAAAPAYLKAAGFGDVIGKFVAMVDWRASNLVTGEYYCPRVGELTRNAAKKVASMADRVGKNDPETAGQLMEALVITGIAMTFAGCTRPASGAEHIVSHFWEIQKLANGEISDFHGKKVGIATVIVNRIYHQMAMQKAVSASNYSLDWNAIERAYGESFMADVRLENSPPINDRIDPGMIEKNWSAIRDIIYEELPSETELLRMMELAGAATLPSEAEVNDSLAIRGVKFSGYMRDRFTLLRIADMIGMGDLLVP